MKKTAAISLFTISILVLSSCLNSEEHKHGTQEEWQHQNHNHALNDTALQTESNSKPKINQIIPMENFKEKFYKVLVDTLSISQEQITPEAKFKEDLGVDSLDMVELVMEFEKEFKISIPDEAAENIFTVADAENFVRMRIATTKTIL